MATENVGPGGAEPSGVGQPGQGPARGTEGQRGAPGRAERREAGGRGGFGREQAPGLAGIRPFLASPLSLIRRLIEDMDRLVEDASLAREAGLAPGGRERGGGPERGAGGPERELGGLLAEPAWVPPVEMFVRDGHLIVRIDLPGVEDEDIRVDIEDNSLVVEGERRAAREEQREEAVRSEFEYGVFRRVIPLPEGTDLEGAVADLDNGVLEVALRLPEEAQRGTRIPVRTRQAGEAQRQPGAEGRSPDVH